MCLSDITVEEGSGSGKWIGEGDKVLSESFELRGYVHMPVLEYLLYYLFSQRP